MHITDFGLIAYRRITALLSLYTKLSFDIKVEWLKPGAGVGAGAGVLT